MSANGQRTPGRTTKGRASRRRRSTTSEFSLMVTEELRDGNLDKSMEASDFFFQLGLLYDLPNRAATTDPSARPAARGTRKWLVVTALVVTLAGLLTPRQAEEPVIRVLPVDVLGVWKTSSPAYEDRTVRLYADRIGLEFGGLAPPVEFPIRGVRRSSRGDTLRFDVSYAQEGGLTRMAFTFVRGPIPTIQLSHPGGVDWVRATDPPTPRPTDAGIARQEPD